MNIFTLWISREENLLPLQNKIYPFIQTNCILNPSQPFYKKILSFIITMIGFLKLFLEIILVSVRLREAHSVTVIVVET